MSDDPPKTTVRQTRYVQANRELIADPAVVEEFDRLAAFLLGSQQGMGQREVERDLDYGQDRDPTFEFERSPLDFDGFTLTLNAAREGAYAASIAAGLTVPQATAAADAAEAALRAKQAVKTTVPPPYPGLGPDPGDPAVFTLPPDETVLVVPFSLVIATDGAGNPGGSVTLIPAGHGDMTLMDISAVYTSAIVSGGYTLEQAISSTLGDVIDPWPLGSGVPFPFERDVSAGASWSTDFRALFGGYPMTAGGAGIDMTVNDAGGPFQTWTLIGTITMTVAGYVP